MQRSSVASAVIAVAAILLLTLPEARGIQCYHCNSKKDPGCEELAPAPANATGPATALASGPAKGPATPRYLTYCEDGPKGEPAFCRKSVITVLAANKGEGETRIVRACGWVQHHRECYKADDQDHLEQVCQCFTDACNAAPRARPAAPSAALLLLLLLPALAAARLR